MNYVVTEKGEFIIGKKVDMPGGGHIDLAEGKPVLTAGEVRLVEGQIKYIDNSSGHYEPIGSAAQQVAENAFKKLGFDVAKKYIEKIWIPDPRLPKRGVWRPQR